MTGAGYRRRSLEVFLTHGTVTPSLPDEALPGGEELEVVVHNDNYTPQNVVVDIFTEVFGHEPATATNLMLQVHREGRTIVVRRPRAEAISLSHAAIARARAAGAPLRITLEPPNMEAP